MEIRGEAGGPAAEGGPAAAGGAAAGRDGGGLDSGPQGGEEGRPERGPGEDGAGNESEGKGAARGPGPGVEDDDEEDAAALRSRLRGAEARAAGLEDQLRRALADYRNLERRSREGVEAAVRDRVARFAADMVSVRDDFERAARVAAAPGAAAPGGAAGAGEGAVSAGLDTVLRGMDSALSKHGVEPIEAIGEIFDPRRHEAVATAEDAALDEGTITAEVARGYSLDERIIRPSRVVTSKKPATEEAGV